MKLESTYKELVSLCNGLKYYIDQPIPRGITESADSHRARNIATSVKNLSNICKDDCNELLQVITKLKAKTGAKGAWASFRIALRMAWEKKKIDELEERLSRDQTNLILHICALSK